MEECYACYERSLELGAELTLRYNFDEIIDRRGTYSFKWSGSAVQEMYGSAIHWDEDTIPMMTADMDLACPPKLVEAMHRVADHRIFGYTTTRAEPRYKQCIIDWYKRRYHTELKPEWINYSDGSVTSIDCLVEAMTNVGDGVIIMPPVYGHFNSMIEEEMHGRKVVPVYLIEEDTGYRIDWDLFEEQCAVPTNRAFLLCSPCNPIGKVWSVEELRRMVDICQRNHVLLISDEIHSDLVRKGVVHHPILSVTDNYQGIAMVIGINKSFNVAGLHVANIVIPDSTLRGIFTKEYGMRLPTPFAIAAQIAAYDECEEWLDALNEYLDANIDFAIAYFAEHMPRLKVRRPEGTYILWLDFRGYGLSEKEVYDRIYNKANVILNNGSEFDAKNGQLFQRMCLTLPRAKIKVALERIAKEFEG